MICISYRIDPRFWRREQNTSKEKSGGKLLLNQIAVLIGGPFVTLA